MALIQCHECSTQISDHARTCPKCGAPVLATIKRKQKAALIDFGVRVVFAVIIIIVTLIWFHKFMAPLKKAEQEQQLQMLQQQRQMAAAGPPVMTLALSRPIQKKPLEPSWVKLVKLEAINGTSDHRIAIINGQTFETGDEAVVKIGGKKITVHCLEIRASSVSVSIEGIDGTRELTMAEN